MPSYASNLVILSQPFVRLATGLKTFVSFHSKVIHCESNRLYAFLEEVFKQFTPFTRVNGTERFASTEQFNYKKDIVYPFFRKLDISKMISSVSLILFLMLTRSLGVRRWNESSFRETCILRSNIEGRRKNIKLLVVYELFTRRIEEENVPKI